MALATVLLQPQRFKRPPSAVEVSIGEDLLRTLTILFEDAIADGPLAAAVVRSVDALGARMQAQIEPRFNVVRDRLRVPALGLVDYLKSLATQAAEIDGPAAAFTLALRMLDDLEKLLGTFTLPGLRTRIQFVLDVLRNDLGLSDEFLTEQVSALLQGAATELDRLALTDASMRSKRRHCAASFRRLDRFLAGSTALPTITADELARALFAAHERAGVTELLEQARCALKDFEAAAESGADLGAALSFSGPGGGDVGAALAASAAGSTYSWYASWLLSDEDLPLLGLGDLKNGVEVARRVLDGTEPVIAAVRDTLSTAQQAALRAAVNGASGTDLEREAAVLLLGKLNEIVQGELFYDSERFEGLSLPSELVNLTNEAIGDQDVLLANRRFFEHLFRPHLEPAHGGVRRWFGRKFLGVVDWPRNQVYVTEDGTTIMCDDMPLLIGENLKWHDAPIFSRRARGQTFWIFEHVSPEVCEHIAFHSAWPTTLGKAVWHLVNVILDQPGHRIGGATYVAMEFAEALDQFIFGKPISGYERLGAFGKWLASALLGPRALALAGGSFQGIHTNATTGNIFLFWITVLAGDVIRTAAPALMLNTLRDLVLSFITLMNFGGPRQGPSKLPANPAQNHLKQDPIASLMNTLFRMWLISYYKREDYSIELFSADNIGDRRKRALKLWLGGGILMSLLTGTATTLVAQITAWAEDWPRFGKTLGFAALDHLLMFWLIVYLQKEGDTDDGRFTTSGAAFRGYPDKSTSPYRLPWAAGESLFAGQSNMGLWSHNDISADAKQLYAVDFGHDHQQPIRAARGGIIHDFVENNPDTSTASANWIVIMHTTVDPVHDDPRGTGPVTTYARYLHGAQNGVTNAFALRGLMPAVGMAVNQGDVIMLADDTGKSFHSHLHMDVVMDRSGTVVAPGAGDPGDVGIPFVFREIRGEGRPINLTWYTSENG